MVRAAGLEPARTKAQDFKSRVATDYTMPAYGTRCRLRSYHLSRVGRALY